MTGDTVVEGTLVEEPGSPAGVADLVPAAGARGWTPKGKVADALAGQLAPYDPNGRLSAAAEEMFRAGERDSTVRTMATQFLRFAVWACEHGFDVLPTDKATCQEWIAANYTMTYPANHPNPKLAGKLRGRNGQPYAPNTVRLSLAAIARAHRRFFSRHPDELTRYIQRNTGVLDEMVAAKGRNRGAMPTPTAHDDVTQSMKGYARKWEEAGYVEDEAASLTIDEMYAMVRTCDLTSVHGVRDAALMRLAADVGRRNIDMVGLDWARMTWKNGGRLLQVRVVVSKNNTDGRKRDYAIVEPDTLYPELCALKLFREWQSLSRVRGFTEGPVFRQVRGTGQARKDGSHRGVILAERMTKKNYIDVVSQAAALSGVNVDDEGDVRKVVPHSFRVFMARRSLAAGTTIGDVCDQGGWSRDSPVVLRYDREANREREGTSPGARIREAELVRREAELARREAELAKAAGGQAG